MSMDVDMSGTKRFREKMNKEDHGIRISYTDLIVKATVEALKQNPLVNSKLEGDNIKLFDKIHIGVAVAIESGLIVPVLRNADEMSIIEIAQTMKHLIQKAKSGSLMLSEVTGGTFTITNLGAYGIDIFTPLLNPTQSAILAVGRIVQKPIIVNGEIAIRYIMSISLSFDHRVIDGAVAAVFMQGIKKALESYDS
jgi:pyruvate dehydrogenase E2 component (dihydrolipoamide acetyltransferase)